MLQLQSVESGYGMGQVLFDVSLSVAPGACVSLMGRNGMGKTTTVRTIMGQLPLIGGQIHRFGDNQPDIMPFEIARAGIGLVPEGRQVFSNLTVAENLQTFSYKLFQDILSSNPFSDRKCIAISSFFPLHAWLASLWDQPPRLFFGLWT